MVSVDCAGIMPDDQGLDPPTPEQRKCLLKALREGYLLAGACQLAGIDPVQLEQCGEAFAGQCQFAYEQGTAALDKQAVELAVEGIPSPLLAFILKSRAARYRDQQGVQVGVAIGGDQASGQCEQRIRIEFVQPGPDHAILPPPPGERTAIAEFRPRIGPPSTARLAVEEHAPAAAPPSPTGSQGDPDGIAETCRRELAWFPPSSDFPRSRFR